MEIRMASTAGVEGRFTGGRIAVLPDRPPVVTIAPPTPAAPARLTYHAVDDFGLARLDAELSLPSGPKVMPLALNGDTPDQSGVLRLDPSQLDLPPDQEVEIRVRAEDRGGQFALSPPVRMQISHAPSAPTPPSSAPTSNRSENTQLVDPTGFTAPLGAYFDAISRPRRR
jgi:hypothetical protein